MLPIHFPIHDVMVAEKGQSTNQLSGRGPFRCHREWRHEWQHGGHGSGRRSFGCVHLLDQIFRKQCTVRQYTTLIYLINLLGKLVLGLWLDSELHYFSILRRIRKMSILSSTNVTDVNLVLKERTHMPLCLNMLIFTHNLGNWLIKHPIVCLLRRPRDPI